MLACLPGRWSGLQSTKSNNRRPATGDQLVVVTVLDRPSLLYRPNQLVASHPGPVRSPTVPDQLVVVTVLGWPSAVHRPLTNWLCSRSHRPAGRPPQTSMEARPTGRDTGPSVRLALLPPTNWFQNWSGRPPPPMGALMTRPTGCRSSTVPDQLVRPPPIVTARPVANWSPSDLSPRPVRPILDLANWSSGAPKIFSRRPPAGPFSQGEGGGKGGEHEQTGGPVVFIVRPVAVPNGPPGRPTNWSQFYVPTARARFVAPTPRTPMPPLTV